MAPSPAALVRPERAAGRRWRPERPERGAGVARWLALLSIALAVLPILVSAARAVADDWFPVGDNGLLAIRARDVATHDHPLLGTWTSASVSLGIDVNNPGPLLFDVLALPARVFGMGPGVALGSALLNLAAVAGIAGIAWRRGGPLLTAVAMAATAGLSWAMGSELLHEPWQPHSLLLPFVCFLFLAWSLACGDLVLLPWAVAVGSLIVQTHLSYSFLVPVLAGYGALALVLDLRRRARTSGGPLLRRSVRRALALSAVVALVLWVQPLIEQVAGEGRGNLGRLLESARHPPATVGYGTGARLLASVVAMPPWWLRPSFAEAWFASLGDDLRGPGGVDLPSLWAALVALGVVTALLVWCIVSAHRRGDRTTARVATTAMLAMAVGVATAARVPVSQFGLAPHQFRWLWPLGAFATFALAVALVRRVSPTGSRATWTVGAFTALAAALALLNLPASDQGASADPAAIPVVRDLSGQLDELEGTGPYLVDSLFQTFGDAYGAGVLADLHERGVPFVAEAPGIVRQLGPRRRYTGHNADAELLLRSGDAAREGMTGARRVALHDALSAREHRELTSLERQLARHITTDGLRLTRPGRQAVAEGRLPQTASMLAAGQVDAGTLLSSRELLIMIRDDLLAADGTWSGRFDRYAQLQRRDDTETVGIFVRPLR